MLAPPPDYRDQCMPAECKYDFLSSCSAKSASLGNMVEAVIWLFGATMCQYKCAVQRVSSH